LNKTLLALKSKKAKNKSSKTLLTTGGYKMYDDGENAAAPVLCTDAGSDIGATVPFNPGYQLFPPQRTFLCEVAEWRVANGGRQWRCPLYR
jgi:hypothetical protein